MTLATLGALGCTWFVADMLGGDGGAVQAALIAVAVGSLLTVAPVVLRIGVEHWGVAVLFSGMARGLVALAVAYVITQGNAQLAARPVFLGTGAGVLLLLIVESALAITILSQIERRRVALRHAGAESLKQA